MQARVAREHRFFLTGTAGRPTSAAVSIQIIRGALLPAQHGGAGRVPGRFRCRPPYGTPTGRCRSSGRKEHTMTQRASTGSIAAGP